MGSGCRLVGEACEEAMNRKQFSHKVALLHGGSTKNREWTVVADAYSPGLNHIWDKSHPNSSECDGIPTGRFALSESERYRIINPSNCGN